MLAMEFCILWRAYLNALTLGHICLIDKEDKLVWRPLPQGYILLRVVMHCFMLIWPLGRRDFGGDKPRRKNVLLRLNYLCGIYWKIRFLCGMSFEEDLR